MVKLWKGLFWGGFIGLMLSIIEIISGIFANSLIFYDLFILIIFLLLFLLGFNKYYMKFYRKCKKLRRQKWFQDLLNRHSFLLIYNSSIQKFIEKSDVEDILNDRERKEEFENDLRNIIVRENL